jgi:hypothetical protein
MRLLSNSYDFIADVNCVRRMQLGEISMSIITRAKIVFANAAAIGLLSAMSLQPAAAQQASNAGEQITGSAAGAVSGNPLVDSGVTGHNVIRVDYDGGFFESMNDNLGDPIWVQFVTRGADWVYHETDRNDWSVDLRETADDTRLQINIERQMITFIDENGATRDAYPITSARR